MASIHGSYRKVEETLPALRMIGQYLQGIAPRKCIWWLDRPVSNSGRVSRIIQELAMGEGWSWQTQLVSDPDPLLRQSSDVVITADSVILDGCSSWANLGAEIVARGVPDAWVIPLGAVDSPD
jgi:hypothetical protein